MVKNCLSDTSASFEIETITDLDSSPQHPIVESSEPLRINTSVVWGF